MMDCILPGHGYSLVKSVKVGEKGVSEILRTEDQSFEVIGDGVAGPYEFIVESSAVAFWERA